MPKIPANRPISTANNKIEPKAINTSSNKSAREASPKISNLKIQSNTSNTNNTNNRLQKVTLKPPIPRQTPTVSDKSIDKSVFDQKSIPLMPFIEDIDLQDELVTIRNPSSSTRDLSGWKISDDHGRNKFVIPEGTKVDPKGMLNIYCCAKGHKGAAAASLAGNEGETVASSLKKPYIFWTNKDGTPRMKNVLNDGRLYIHTYAIILINNLINK
jgi:hypothetical protein